MINIGKAKAHLHKAEQALNGDEWKRDDLGSIAHALTGFLDLYIQETEEAQQTLRDNNQVIALINKWVDAHERGSNVLNIKYAIHDLRTAIGDTA